MSLEEGQAQKKAQTSTTTTTTPQVGTGGGGGTGTGTQQPIVINFPGSDRIEFDPAFGAPNTEFYGQEFGGDFGGMVWQEMLWQRLPKELALWAEQNNQDPGFYQGWIQANFAPGLLPFLDNQMYFMFAELPGAAGGGAEAMQKWAGTPQGLATIHTWAWDWMRMQQPNIRQPNRKGSGSGRRGPTAAEIRASFDLDLLTNRANELWQTLVLEDNAQARAQAKAYVEAIVRNPEQKLDFDTFIEEQAKKTARFGSIYRNLPNGMNPRQYMAPYIAMASQFAAPGEVNDLAIGGAQFGADPAAFRARLGRTDAVTSSAPFIQGLENRMRDLSGVLRG